MSRSRGDLADALAAISAVASCHAELRAVASATEASFFPEPVPPTVALGELGFALVTLAEELDDAVLEGVGRVVEDLLAEPGLVADVVATGFLEAICARSVAAPGRVERVVARLGARALTYIRAWDAFTGAETPGASLPP